MPMGRAAGGVEGSDLGGSACQVCVGSSAAAPCRCPGRRRPSRLGMAPGSGGPWVALGGAVLTVEVSDRLVERRLAAGEMRCPGCGEVLAPWGWARERVLRGSGDGRVRLRPRRTRCRGCAVTHVLRLAGAQNTQVSDACYGASHGVKAHRTAVHVHVRHAAHKATTQRDGQVSALRCTGRRRASAGKAARAIRRFCRTVVICLPGSGPLPRTR
jgi:hypothetical protein